jgi:nitrite reductase/ring-hydroxylating ferredoxin subunit/uncharacterized membrane protein
MKSRASLGGHPVHPMLIVYPFAFLTGAFGFGLAGALGRRPHLTQVARALVPAGLGAGVAAAVPGIVDYFGSIPPHSSARQRGARHGLLNAAGLGIFAASWLLGRNGRRTMPLVLQGIGTGIMSVAAHMGGTLVYRNQIGIDHRYAGAGRWQEETHDRFDPVRLAASGATLGTDQMKLVHAGDSRVVVARTSDGCVAFDDRCTHRGGPLSDGVLIDGIVQCPWHGSQFDVATGEVLCGPAEDAIRTYPDIHARELDAGRRTGG